MRQLYSSHWHLQ